jgi:hypothetical protein
VNLCGGGAGGPPTPGTPPPSCTSSPRHPTRRPGADIQGWPQRRASTHVRTASGASRGCARGRRPAGRRCCLRCRALEAPLSCYFPLEAFCRAGGGRRPRNDQQTRGEGWGGVRTGTSWRRGFDQWPPQLGGGNPGRVAWTNQQKFQAKMLRNQETISSDARRRRRRETEERVRTDQRTEEEHGARAHGLDGRPTHLMA